MMIWECSDLNWIVWRAFVAVFNWFGYFSLDRCIVVVHSFFSGGMGSHKKNKPSSMKQSDLVEKSKSAKQTKARKSTQSERLKRMSQIKSRSSTSKTEHARPSTRRHTDSTPTSRHTSSHKPTSHSRASSSRVQSGRVEKSKSKSRQQANVRKKLVSKVLKSQIKSHGQANAQEVVSRMRKSESQMNLVSSTDSSNPSTIIDMGSTTTSPDILTQSGPTSSPTSNERVEKSMCKSQLSSVWTKVVLGVGAVLFLVGITIVIVYYSMAESNVSKDMAQNSTEKTPTLVSLKATSNTSSPSSFKSFDSRIPPFVEYTGYAIIGLVVLYLLGGLAVLHLPCMTRLVGDNFVFHFEREEVMDDYGSVNFTLTHTKDSQDNGITLGVRFMPPLEKASQTCSSFSTNEKKQDNVKELLNSDDKYVILMALGSEGNRSEFDNWYSIATRELHYNAMVFDYRGNADSSPVRPTIKGLVADLRLVYDWILNSGKPREEVLIWGYSLGTAVVIEMLSNLKPDESPHATILSAAPVSLKKVIQTWNHGHCLNALKKVSLLNYFIANGLQKNPDFAWDSLSKLPKIHCPLLYLHAKDDDSISFEQGVQLYNAAKLSQPEVVWQKTAFHWFEADRHYRHDGMFTAPKLWKIIEDFITSLH